MEEHEIVRALAALAHPLRLRVFRALVVVGHDGLTPGVMAQALAASGTALSFHPEERAHAGLVNPGPRRAQPRLPGRIPAHARPGLPLTRNGCAGVECAVVARGR